MELVVKVVMSLNFLALLMLHSVPVPSFLPGLELGLDFALLDSSGGKFYSITHLYVNG